MVDSAMPRAKLVWDLRSALMRHAWATVTLASKHPPCLEDSDRLWSPHLVRRGRLVWVDMKGEHFKLPFSEEDFRRQMKCSSGNTRITRIEALETVQEVA
jgi:hypothetical protein